MDNINVYVGSDGKIHFVDKDGADTALPFNNNVSFETLLSRYKDGNDSATITTAKKYLYLIAFCTASNKPNENCSTSISYLQTIASGRKSNDGRLSEVRVAYGQNVPQEAQISFSHYYEGLIALYGFCN